MRAFADGFGAGGGGGRRHGSIERDEVRRTEDLLADRALFGRLDAAQAVELARLLERRPHLDDGSFERAAAALTLALADVAHELPLDLRHRLERTLDES